MSYNTVSIYEKLCIPQLIAACNALPEAEKQQFSAALKTRLAAMEDSFQYTLDLWKAFFESRYTADLSEPDFIHLPAALKARLAGMEDSFQYALDLWKAFFESRHTADLPEPDFIHLQEKSTWAALMIIRQHNLFNETGFTDLMKRLAYTSGNSSRDNPAEILALLDKCDLLANEKNEKNEKPGDNIKFMLDDPRSAFIRHVIDFSIEKKLWHFDTAQKNLQAISKQKKDFAIYALHWVNGLSVADNEKKAWVNQLVFPHSDKLYSPSLLNLWKRLSLPTPEHRAKALALCTHSTETEEESIQTAVIDFLLNDPDVLAFAEKTGEVYQAAVNTFIDNTLQSLAAKREIFQRENPETTFDISPEEAKCCFYILRNRIRCTHPELNQNMNDLLEIPAVRSLAATEVTPGFPNELFALAMQKGRHVAAHHLLDIPEVRRVAEQSPGGIAAILQTPDVEDDWAAPDVADLAELAQNEESAMEKLTESERKRLKEVTELYGPLLEAGGSQNIVEALRDELASLYKKTPPHIKLESEEDIALPLVWKNFELLNLSPDLYSQALKAYHQHTIHTAWRFLLKPNPWIDPAAIFVESNPENRSERWSAFGRIESLIAIMWLAVQDSQVPPTDDIAMEDRIHEFYAALALMNRAHNWVQGDSFATHGKETDNLGPDVPTCYPGMERAIFSAGKWHPRLNFLTPQKISQELSSCLYNHFKEKITSDNYADLAAHYNNYIENLEPEDANALAILNVPCEEQESFIGNLRDKYGKQFIEDPYFENMLRKQFALCEGEVHAIKLGGLGHIMHLFEQAPRLYARLQGSPARQGMFGISAENNARSGSTMEPISPTLNPAPGFDQNASVKRCMTWP